MKTITVMASQYCRWLAEHHYSPNTVKLITRQLGVFTEWCEARGKTIVTQVDKDAIRKYEAHTHNIRKKDGDPLSVYAKSQRISAIKTFFTWLTKQSMIVYNPAADIELPKTPRRLPRHFFTIEEAEAVINAPDINTPLGLRDRAMMEVLYSTGMRKMEITGLRLQDIEFASRLIMIRSGKGNKDRVVPIGARALTWVERYLMEVREQLVDHPDDGLLFLSSTGKDMYSGGLSDIVRKYIKKAGIDKKGSCHLFRHTCATLMLEHGADVRYIQELLGHEHLSTTQIYTSVTVTKLREVHERCHPARALGSS